MTHTLPMTACALAVALAAGVANAQCPHDLPRPGPAVAHPAPPSPVHFLYQYFGLPAPCPQVACTTPSPCGVYSSCPAESAVSESDASAHAAAAHMLDLCRSLCREGKYSQAAAVARAVAAVQPENVVAGALLANCELHIRLAARNRAFAEAQATAAAEACEPIDHNRVYQARLRARAARVAQAAQAEGCKCHKDGQAACICQGACKCMPPASEPLPPRRVSVGVAIRPDLRFLQLPVPLPVPVVMSAPPCAMPCPPACGPCPQVQVALPVGGVCSVPLPCPRGPVSVNGCGVACPPVAGGCCAPAQVSAPVAAPGAVRISASNGRVRIAAAGIEMECDRMYQHGPGGKVELEGNVTVEFRREGRPAAVVADRIAVHLQDCSYEVNPHTIRTVPVKPIKPVWHRMVVPATRPYKP